MDEDKYAAALAAIKEIYGDTSVERSTTRDTLKNLKDEIDILIDTLSDEDE
ncbi:MAG: hypothetical protein M3458_14875 [Acidobacteriota bacterium]|nr:hypothetical protein [Acidobacteriota bacterium]